MVVGEGPGHVRDTEMALVESGVQAAAPTRTASLRRSELRRIGVDPQRRASAASPLAGFYFPRSIVEADLVVSMPKLKTHHWVGFTASMKNLYGTLPGLRYGWPKNVLHHAGIPQTVYDINATLPKTLAIVDGIVGMEGDGPIMGSPKPLGLVLIGANLTAVDATVARIMGLAPERVSYLSLAADSLGPIADSRITQRGEPWRPLVNLLDSRRTPFADAAGRAGGTLVDAIAAAGGSEHRNRLRAAIRGTPCRQSSKHRRVPQAKPVPVRKCSSHFRLSRRTGGASGTQGTPGDSISCC